MSNIATGEVVPQLTTEIPPDVLATREFVGAGGFGNVYRLEHPTLGVLAVKEIREAGQAAEIANQRRIARKEASIWYGLQHPHILELVGILESELSFCFVCPFVQRGSLRDYFKTNGPSPNFDRSQIVVECLDALAYLHAKEIIHGDIKAANILLTDDFHAQICDFGLSRSVNVSTSSSRRGQGSIRWMSPELLNNGGRKSFASDVWAVGMTIYEIISGSQPYEDLTGDMSIILDIFNHKLPPMEPTHGGDGVSYQALWAIVFDCWRYDPTERPTMSDLYQRIRVRAPRQTPPSSPQLTTPMRNNVPDSDDLALVDPRHQRVTILSAHALSVNCVTFSPDSRTLVSASKDSTIRFWDVPRAIPLGEPIKGQFSSPFESVAFSPDGTTLVSGSNDGPIHFWDVSTGRMMGEPVFGHTLPVWCTVFSPDGRRVASASHDKTIRVWDAVSKTCLAALGPLKESVNSIAFSPDGKMLASGWNDHTVRLWDLATYEQIDEPLVGHSGWVRTVAFSPDSSAVASGSDDGTIRLWDTTSKGSSRVLAGHSALICSVAFHPRGRVLASGSKDKSIRIWDLSVTPPTTKLTLDGHGDWVRSVAFSPDGRYLASASLDRTVCLWDLEVLLA